MVVSIEWAPVQIGFDEPGFVLPGAEVLALLLALTSFGAGQTACDVDSILLGDCTS